MKLCAAGSIFVVAAFEVHHNGRSDELGQWTKKEKLNFYFKAVITLCVLVLRLN